MGFGIPHPRHDHDLRQLAGGCETVVERLEHRIPIAGAHRRHVKRLADVRPPAPDAAPSLERAALEGVGRDTDQRSDLLAAHAAKLGQQRNQRAGQYCADSGGDRMSCEVQPMPDGREWHYRTKVGGDPRICWYPSEQMKPRSELYWDTDTTRLSAPPSDAIDPKDATVLGRDAVEPKDACNVREDERQMGALIEAGCAFGVGKEVYLF